MNNEEKIISLLEEIRDKQKANVEMALAMQKKVQRKVFWALVIIFILGFLIYKLK